MFEKKFFAHVIFLVVAKIGKLPFGVGWFGAYLSCCFSGSVWWRGKAGGYEGLLAKSYLNTVSRYFIDSTLGFFCFFEVVKVTDHITSNLERPSPIFSYLS